MDKSLIETARRFHKLSDIVRPYTRLKPAAGGWLGLCPLHREKTPSFHVSDVRGTFKCFGCNAWGDTFDFIMTFKGIGFAEAVKSLMGEFVSPPIDYDRDLVGALREKAEKREIQDSDEKRRIHHAHEIWMRRQPIGDNLAARYLRDTRGLMGVLPETLGYVFGAYCSPLEEEVPALIAPLQDRHGHVTAVQQIFLCGETLDAYRDNDGRRIKRTLGVMRDGCVRLGVPDAALGIAGSVEDALAASMMFSLPVWATCGEARFSQVWIPEEVEHLFVFADADEPGRRAALGAEQAHKGQRDVTLRFPTRGMKDFAQMAEGRVTA